MESAKKMAMYKTAVVDTNDSDTFANGTIVAVEFVAMIRGNASFRCTRDECVEVLKDYELKDFVL